MKANKKRGISLIVLVITIIVMIILATAIILSLSNSGIIGKANEAKKKNNEAVAKELENMSQIDDILNGTELVYNKPAYDVKVNVWVYKMDASGEYNTDTPVLETYIMYPNYKSGDKVSLLKDICDKIKGENQSVSSQNSSISTQEFPTIPTYYGKYRIYAIGQQVPKGTEDDYLIDTADPAEIKIKPHNGVYDMSPFYMIFGEGIRACDSVTGATMLDKVINNKRYKILGPGFTPSTFNLFTSGGFSTDIEISQDGVYDENGQKIDFTGEQMYRNCAVRCIIDNSTGKSPNSEVYVKMFDKRIDKREFTQTIQYLIEDLDGESELLSNVFEIPCTPFCSVLSGFNINFSVSQDKDKKLTLENCCIYIGQNYNINYAKKYISINDDEITVNIPSVEDDITILIMNNQKFK